MSLVCMQVTFFCCGDLIFRVRLVALALDLFTVVLLYIISSHVTPNDTVKTSIEKGTMCCRVCFDSMVASLFYKPGTAFLYLLGTNHSKW